MADVTIDGSQWSVTVASTTAELMSGLSGVASIPANTGVLFDMGSDQDSITINTASMLFSLDIAFINSSGVVVGILRNVAPGEVAAFDAGNGLGARYFLEVNAGEMGGISVGDNMVISGYTPNGGTPSAGIDLSQIVIAMIAVGMMGMVMKIAAEPTHHSIHGLERARLVRQYGSWAVGRAESVCPEDDVVCVDNEAAWLLAKHKVGRWLL